MIAFKTFALCPEEQRPEGISLSCPWIEEIVHSEEKVIQLIDAGYTVLTEDAYERYKKSISSQLYIENVIENSILFGAQLLREFSAENVLLGITQENKTGEVLTKLSGVMSAIIAGSLYEAINRTKAIPSSDYDSKYITAARLIKFLNRIETYLGIPLTETL